MLTYTSRQSRFLIILIAKIAISTDFIDYEVMDAEDSHATDPSDHGRSGMKVLWFERERLIRKSVPGQSNELECLMAGFRWQVLPITLSCMLIFNLIAAVAIAHDSSKSRKRTREINKGTTEILARLVRCVIEIFTLDSHRDWQRRNYFSCFIGAYHSVSVAMYDNRWNF